MMVEIQAWTGPPTLWIHERRKQCNTTIETPDPPTYFWHAHEDDGNALVTPRHWWFSTTEAAGCQERWENPHAVLGVSTLYKRETVFYCGKVITCFNSNLKKSTGRRRSALCIRVHVAPSRTFTGPSPWYCMAPTYYGPHILLRRSLSFE